MSDEVVSSPAARPMWKRIVDYPLVAMVIAVALYLALTVVLGLAFGAAPDAATDWAGGAIPAVISVVALFALYKLAIRHLGERKHDDLAGQGAGRQLGLGALGGGALISLSVGIAALAGVYKLMGWGGGSDLAMIVFQMGLFAGFGEELLFRGILFRWIEEFGGSWAALAVTSILFGLAHAMNDNASVVSTVAIMFEAGVLLGAAYMLTRRLWVPIGIHFGWNVTQGGIFDVPVSGYDVDGLVEARLVGPDLLSGGTFGLEASVIALVVCTGAGIWLAWKAVQAGQIMQPHWVRRRELAGSDETVRIDVDADAHAVGEVERP